MTVDVRNECRINMNGSPINFAILATIVSILEREGEVYVSRAATPSFEGYGAMIVGRALQIAIEKEKAQENTCQQTKQ